MDANQTALRSAAVNICRNILIPTTLLLLLLGPAYCQLSQAGQPSRAESSAEAKNRSSENPGESAWQVLNEALSGDDSSKRTEAVAALSVVGARAPVTELIESFLHDKESSVRQAAVVTLGELKSRRSIPKLRQALDDNADEVSFSAARVLWDMRDTSGRLVLIEVLAGERGASEGAVHGQIRELKKKIKNPAALALFGVKQAGVLGPFGIGLSLAEELRKDRSASARILAADALASDRNPGTPQELEVALADKSWAVRAAAAQALAKRGYRHSILALNHLLADKNDIVKYTAAGAIVHLTRTRYPGKLVRE
jgi:HEAT repeat protein